MREVLSSDVDGLMIGIADIFENQERYDDVTNGHWKKHLARFRGVWYKYLIKGKKYCILVSGTAKNGRRLVTSPVR